jgi:hypothetical protein
MELADLLLNILRAHETPGPKRAISPSAWDLSHYSPSALSHAAGGEQLASLGDVPAHATAVDAHPE